MREDIAGPQGASSRPMWETLEGMVREKAQEFIQQIMEEEVTELLGRKKSERGSRQDGLCCSEALGSYLPFHSSAIGDADKARGRKGSAPAQKVS